MTNNLAETSIYSQNRQSSVYCDCTDSEADYEITEASFLIEDTEIADVNSDALQVFQREERSVESDNAYSVSLRTSLANSIASLRRRCIKSHDVSLEDFVEPDTEMIGNTSEEYFDDFIRSDQRIPTLQEPTEFSHDTDNSEVVIVAEEIPNYSKKHKEALSHSEWLTKYEEDQVVFDKRLIDETKRHSKVVETKRRKAQITSKQRTLITFLPAFGPSPDSVYIPFN